jgi:rod shape-determining protein MreC
VPLYSAGRRRVIIALALTSALLLTLDLRGNRLFDAARSGFTVALQPFQQAAEVASTPIERLWRAYSDFDALEEENRVLRAQVDAQRSAEIAAQNAIIENQDLLALNSLESLASYDSVTARLVGQSPTNFDQQVEIDRGSIHGIRVGMSAVNEAGLVGKVTRVAPTSSVIMLVTDPSYAVQVKILSVSAEDPEQVVPGFTTTTVAAEEESFPGADQGAVREEFPIVTSTTTTVALADAVILPEVEVIRETGVLRGQGDERLPRVSFVVGNSAFGRIEIGDTVFTAGGSTSLAPPNIPVGRVANVITRAGTAGQELEIALSPDLGRLQFVRVVLYQPPTELQP